MGRHDLAVRQLQAPPVAYIRALPAEFRLSCGAAVAQVFEGYRGIGKGPRWALRRLLVSLTRAKSADEVAHFVL